ncbi:MAG: PAS domain-containing protein [Bacteroidota bacterium]
MADDLQLYVDIKNLPVPIALLDVQLNILEHSHRFYDFFDFIHQDKRPDTLEGLIGTLPKSIASLKKSKGFVDQNIKEFVSYISRKGELRWHKLKLYPNKANKQYYAYFDDITKDKIAFDLSQQAAQTAIIGSWEVDLVNHKIFWSEMTRKIHEVQEDFEPDLETGINFYKEGEHREKIIQVVSEAIENGTPYDVELIIITAKGSEKWVRAIGNAEMVNGKASRIFGVFQDIDKSKRERIKYQELDNRMRVALESVKVGIWDFDIENNKLVWDENMYKLYQVKKDDFSGDFEAWEKTVHPDDKEKSLIELQEAIDGTKNFNTEFRVKTQEGTIKHIHGFGKVFRDKNGKAVRMIGANTDISRIKKADNRLRELLTTTEKQNKSLLNFAHIVSHNLRSNSSNLSMLTGMLLDDTCPEKRERFLEMIKISSERLDDTVVQLNEVIKIQSDPNVNLQWVNVKVGLTEVLESINAHLEEIDPNIDIQIGDNLRVHGVKPYISSIFLNLLTNSLKYRKPNIKLKIVIKAHEEEGYTTISFKDNGRGIDMERHGHKLFGMYKTFHGNKDAKGVGLFISKNQMDAMNAEIEVLSKADQGATFLLRFPNHKKTTA